jgi:hypothetical protein
MSEVDLARLFELKLKPRLSELESRRFGLQRTIIGGILVALLGVGSCSTAYNPGSLASLPWWRYGPLLFGLLSLTCFGLAISRFLMPGFTGYVSYRAVFKKEIVAEVVRALLPGTRHFPDRSMPKSVYDESRLFNAEVKMSADDLLQGAISDTPFEACEMETSYTEGSGDNKKTVKVFHGLFLRVDMDRDCAGRTLVQPSGEAEGDLSGLEAVSFDPAFDDLYTVWSSDASAARTLLDSALRSRLLALSEEIGSLHLSFSGAQAIAGVPFGRNLFEPSLGSRFDLAGLQKLAGPLQQIAVIVGALVPGPRRRPADEKFHAARVEVSGIEAIAGRGDVGMAQLLEAAHQDEEKKAGPAPMPPPANPWARVTDSGSEISVDYPIGFSTLLALAIGLVLTPVVFALLVNWVSPASGAKVAGVVLAWRPNLEPLWMGVREYPTAALLGTAFFWWMFAGAFYVRPGTVTVSSDGVKIRRTGRPWAATLPLDIIRGVQHSNRSVHFIRSDKSLLRSFVQASPNLPSEQETRWIVQELRRALQRAGWRPPVAARSSNA